MPTSHPSLPRLPGFPAHATETLDYADSIGMDDGAGPAGAFAVPRETPGVRGAILDQFINELHAALLQAGAAVPTCVYVLTSGERALLLRLLTEAAAEAGPVVPGQQLSLAQRAMQCLFYLFDSSLLDAPEQPRVRPANLALLSLLQRRLA